MGGNGVLLSESAQCLTISACERLKIKVCEIRDPNKFRPLGKPKL